MAEFNFENLRKTLRQARRLLGEKAYAYGHNDGPTLEQIDSRVAEALDSLPEFEPSKGRATALKYLRGLRDVRADDPLVSVLLDAVIDKFTTVPKPEPADAKEAVPCWDCVCKRCGESVPCAEWISPPGFTWALCRDCYTLGCRASVPDWVDFADSWHTPEPEPEPEDAKESERLEARRLLERATHRLLDIGPDGPILADIEAHLAKYGGAA